MPVRYTTSPSGALSPATGKQIGQHEAAGLKGLTKEQHPKFWEEVIYWNTECFSTAKWQEVLKRIWRAKQEHDMIVLGWNPPPRPIHSIATPGSRHILLYSSSSLTAPTGAHPLRPAHLPRIELASSTTPRPRWDIVSAGPMTPLSATAGPVRNAFAEGGHWASLTPKTSSLADTFTQTTPVTAISLSPSFYIPCTPTESAARSAYEEAKADVNKMALQLCASRHALRRSFTAEMDVIHPSMVRPRDTLLAADLTLSSYRLPGLLSAYIDPVLPSRLEHYADEEATGSLQYSISSLSKLEDVDAWLQYDEKTGQLITILEAQRDLLRMNRERRKGREVGVDEGGIRLAWATKVVGDIEAEVQRRTEVDGEDSDDEGYEYGNFIRSLGGRDTAEMGSVEVGSVKSSGSTLDLSRIHSSTTYSSGRESDLDIAIAQRSSSSPIKPTHDAAIDNLPLRNRTLTLSTPSTTVPLSKSSHVQKDSCHSASNPSYTSTHTPSLSNHSIRRSNATTAPRHGLSITTSGHTRSINKETSLISPQERGTRHRGPSIQDLTSWADELKSMERKRAEMRLDKGMAQGRKVSVACEEGEVLRDDGLEGDAKDGGLVVNGCVHPALRGGGDGQGAGGRRSRGVTGSSTESWRCSTAAGIEGDNLPGPDDAIDTIDYAYDDQVYDDDEEAYNTHASYSTTYIPQNTTPTPHEEYKHPFSSSHAPHRHPPRTSSSPTHPPIRLSSLQNAISKNHPSPSPPRHPPRPETTLLLPPDLILQPPAAYNRYAATSCERLASKARLGAGSLTGWQLGDGQVGALEREHAGCAMGVGKARLLEVAVREGRGVGERREKEKVKEKEEEWDAVLEVMERKERLRQLGGRGDGGS